MVLSDDICFPDKNAGGFSPVWINSLILRSKSSTLENVVNETFVV